LSRGDLMDAEWRILDPLIPDRGERGPVISAVNGILWFILTGAPWCDPPERYGNWNSVFAHFTRWSKLGLRNAAAAGEKGGIKIGKRSAARAAASQPKSTFPRRPFDITGGEAH
jgi:transposase